MARTSRLGSTAARAALGALLAFAGAPSAGADVYRCADASGGIRFSDHPCAGGRRVIDDRPELSRVGRVFGHIASDEHRLVFSDGMAFWENPGSRLVILLTADRLPDAQRQAARRWDWGFLEAHRKAGYLQLQLRFDRGDQGDGYDPGDVTRTFFTCEGLDRLDGETWNGAYDSDRAAGFFSALKVGWRPRLLHLVSDGDEDGVRWTFDLDLVMLPRAPGH